MADGIELDVGTIETDQLLSGKHVQYVKLMDGTLDGTAKATVSAEGLHTKVTSVPADPFGTNADATVAAGAAGSISAKLRAISRDLASGVSLAAGALRIGKVTLRNSADSADIDPLSEVAFTGTLGEVQASPTANTALARLKDILTGVVLAAGSNRIGKVTLRDAANAADIDPLSEATWTATTGAVTANPTANTVLGRLKDLLTGISLAAGTAHIGQIAPELDVITVTPVTSASPDYSIGEAVGGKQTLTSAVRVSGGKAIWDSLFAIDRANVKPQMELLIFDSDPTGAGAAYTDNATVAFGTGDADKLLHRHTIVTADWITVGGIALLSMGNLRKVCKASGSTNLYAVAVATAAINLAATNDMTFKYGFSQG